jgi:CRP/FNR family transcriptional regulator
VVCNRNKSGSCVNCAVQKDSIFSTLSGSEIAQIANYVEKKSVYRAGEYLIKEYQDSHYSLCIKSGYLIMGTHLKDGSRQIFKVVFPGESIGFSSNSDNYFVRAVTDVDVCIVSDSSVKNLLKNHPNVALRLIEILSKNSNSYQQYLLNLGRKNAQEALAYLMMDLSTRIKMQEEKKSRKSAFFPIKSRGYGGRFGFNKSPYFQSFIAI